MAEGGYILAVTPDRDAAPTVLFFGGLERFRPGALQIAQYRHDSLAGALGGASAVVFVRGLFEFADLVGCAERLGIPRYYFLDDHFIVVRDQGGEAAKFARDHSQENVARMLRGFDGVLVSTAPLEADYRRRALHSRLLRFPPIAIPRLEPARPTDDVIRIAFFGGSHLHHVLRGAIVPAVRQLAKLRPVRLVAVGVTGSIAPSPGLTIEHQPYQPSYLAGVRALARAGVSLLVHPVAPGLPSNPYKNPHALITANAIGAIPVVSNAPPYAELRDEGVAVLCEDHEDGWHRGLVGATDATASAAMAKRLADFCVREFSGAANAEIVDSLLAAHRVPTAFEAGARSAAIAATLSAGWLRRGVRRAFAGAAS